MRSIGLVLMLAGCELYFGNNNNLPPPDATARPDGSRVLPDAYRPPPDGALGAACDIHWACPYGQYCTWDHRCVETTECTSDAQAQSGGYAWCDPIQRAARPLLGAQGTCETSIANCGTAPKCPTGQIPTVGESATTPGRFCWTGQCVPLNACDVPPQCSYINDPADCEMMRCSVYGDPYTTSFEGCTGA
jgi:hypothetical protein